MTRLNNIKLSGVLTPSQMCAVKGGNGNGNNGNGNGNGATADDKRKDRPGGGITTL